LHEGDTALLFIALLFFTNRSGDGAYQIACMPWEKEGAWVDSMMIEAAEKMMKGYRNKEPCYKIALEYQHVRNLESGTHSAGNDFTYGEVDFGGFQAAMDLVAPLIAGKSGASFVDLGSGTGMAVMMAALGGSFSHSLGIEIVPGLHQIASRLIRRHNTINDENNLAANAHAVKMNTTAAPLQGRCGGAPTQCHVDLMCCSFMAPAALARWTNADVVFCCSFKFCPTLRSNLEIASRGIHEGAYLILLHQLDEKEHSRWFRFISKDFRRVSWSFAPFYTYVRTAADCTPPLVVEKGAASPVIFSFSPEKLTAAEATPLELSVKVKTEVSPTRGGLGADEVERILHDVVLPTFHKGSVGNTNFDTLM
jgi:hypothetical protein